MINKDRLVESFLEYVQIDSESGNEKGMEEILTSQLKALGLDVYVDKAGEKTGSNGNNVYGFLKGSIDKEPILLSAHIDTVTPGNGVKPVVNGDIITSDGTTILGGDDKSGVVIIMETIRAIVEDKLDTRPIEVVFTIFEEKGLLGAKEVEFDRLKSKEGIAVDTGGPTGTIINQTPAHDDIRVTIKGVPAHAGLEPEKGVSAINIAAKAIAKMPLLRVDEDTTANIGTITGGVASNIVAPEVSIVAETRSKSNEKLDQQGDLMKKIFEDTAKEMGGSADVKIRRWYEALYVPEEERIIKDLKKAFEKNGHEPKCQYAGGGSDANIYFSQGINIVNISSGMTAVHTLEERISITDMYECSKVLFDFLQLD